ncbi:MAG: alkaline phosphatase family protein [Thermoguttaceae bacterium]|nr:alkaline phosphatase family protein [Thermoguttaceae bacterium]MDW8037668.1 alkaline phosphatase family protein [Thermoguttaceae bacterium]
MPSAVVLVSVANLREKDVAVMPQLKQMLAGGEIVELVPSFPALTCPVQANMTTGTLPRDHGVVANGFYWREQNQVEMWTSANDCILQPQIWDILREKTKVRSALWFPLHSKYAQAEYICTPSPIHHPDGSESLWCYTKPPELYGQLCEQFGHFPLQHFWGPLAGIQSTRWIVESAVWTARKFRPEFWYIYIPHLDYAAQRSGPDSAQAQQALQELDGQLGRLAQGFQEIYGKELFWIIAGEYAIVPVSHVVYPNRLLREAGLLRVQPTDDGELLDLSASQAWVLVDHQCGHVFVRDAKPERIRRVVELFQHQEGIAEVLTREHLPQYSLDHPRSGEVVLISRPDSWQAYYWWLDDRQAPRFARTVDIHRKPGYDPVELFFDPANRSIPLNANLVKGSHGAPATSAQQRTVLLVSQPGLLPDRMIRDVDVFNLVLRQFGVL